MNQEEKEFRELLEASNIRHDIATVVALCLKTHEMFCEATISEGYQQGKEYVLKIVYAFNRVIIDHKGHCRVYERDEFTKCWKVSYETLTML